jgi:hypothetical protein
LKTQESLGLELIDLAEEYFSAPGTADTLFFDVVIAEAHIRIYLASQALWDFIYPAFSWQAQKSDKEPDVVIFAVEGDGVLVLPWRAEDFGDRNTIIGLEAGQVVANFDIDNSILNMFDHKSRRGLFWARSTEGLPEWEFGAPLRVVLEWALSDWGLYIVHSAGIGMETSGILICGSGGAGKSTTTALSIGKGFVTTGDDYCAISVSYPPKVFSIYGLIKLVPGSPGTDSIQNPKWVRQRTDKKAHFSLESSMTDSLVIRSILFTKVSEITNQPQPLAPKEALIRLLSSVLNQSANQHQRLFPALSMLAKSAPSFELEVGSDFDKIREVIESLCNQ